MQTWVLLSLGGAGCALVGLVLAGAVFVLSRYLRYRERSERERLTYDSVATTARELQLKETSPGVYEGRAGPSGGIRRLRWTLREVEHPGGGSRLQLALGTPVPTGVLALTHRTMVYGAAPEELELPLCRVGDAEFDVRFHVHADLEHLSILTPTVRDAMLFAADDAELRVRNGWLWLDLPVTAERMHGVGDRIERLFAAANALENVPTEVEQRVRKLSQDEHARVRAQTLDLLAQRGASEFTTWIARALLSNPDRQVQARAVELAQDTGRMVELAGDERASLEVRQRIGRAVAAHGTVEERLEVAGALARGPLALAAVSVDLCRTVGAEAESVLIDLVHHGRGAPVRQAVELLGNVGSARSMVVLQALMDGAEKDGVIRAEAKVALERLRAARRKTTSPPFSPASSPPPSPPERTPVAPASRTAGRKGRPGPPVRSKPR